MLSSEGQTLIFIHLEKHVFVLSEWSTIFFIFPGIYECLSAVLYVKIYVIKTSGGILFLQQFFLYSLSFIDIVFFVFFLDKALVWLFNPSGIKDSQHIWVLYLRKCPFYIKLNNCIISPICVEIISKFLNLKFSQIILIGCHLS